MTQINRLKTLTGSSDTALLNVLLDDAKRFILGYTNRGEADWLPFFNTVQVNAAHIAFNRLGAEGVSSRTEGGISTVFEDFPASVSKALDRFRIAVVV